MSDDNDAPTTKGLLDADGATGSTTGDGSASKEDLQSLQLSVKHDIEELKEALVREQQWSGEAVAKERKERSAVLARVQAESGASLERHVVLLKSVNALEAHLLTQPDAKLLQSRVSALDEQLASESAKRVKCVEQLAECQLQIEALAQKGGDGASNVDHNGYPARFLAVEGRLDSLHLNDESLRAHIMDRFHACEAAITKCSTDFAEYLGQLANEDLLQPSAKGLSLGPNSCVSPRVLGTPVANSAESKVPIGLVRSLSADWKSSNGSVVSPEMRPAGRGLSKQASAVCSSRPCFRGNTLQRSTVIPQKVSSRRQTSARGGSASDQTVAVWPVQSDRSLVDARGGTASAPSHMDTASPNIRPSLPHETSVIPCCGSRVRGKPAGDNGKAPTARIAT